MTFKYTKQLLKTTAIVSAMAFVPLMSPSEGIANPMGGTVASGSATISNAGSHTTINQTSNQVLINWDSFNINAGETTQFIQPTTQSVAVNRIHDVAPSVVNGHLTANGQIVLINQNGMVFGNGAQVDVGSLVVSTADLAAGTDLSSGVLAFDQAGRMDASIVNNGNISVSEAGLASFVAPHITNNGVIRAKLGKVQLSAADTATVDFYGDGLVEIAITEDRDSPTSIHNHGLIDAAGGEIYLTAKAAKGIVDSVINMDGVVNASSINQEGGRVVLSASEIEVSGTITADGATGGGEVLIGGDYQGQGDIETATTTTVTDEALITANVSDDGNGGWVVVWADDTTGFDGQIEAKGKGTGADGFVETSGKKTLTVGSNARVTAGEWLLDPTDVTITNGSGDDVSGGGSFNPASGTVDADTLTAALDNGTSVTITTAAAGGDDGDITLDNATINKTSGGDATLTLQANNSIISDNSTITSSSGALNVTLHADSDNVGGGAIDLTDTQITTNGGNFIAGGGLNPLTDSAKGTASNNDGVVLDNTTIDTDTGFISIRGDGRTGGGIGNEYGVYLTADSIVNTTTGNVTIEGTGGDLSLRNYGIYFNGSGTLVQTEMGAITITGTGGGTNNSQNYGVYINDAQIVSDGPNGDVGDIRITGTAGTTNTTTGNGVYIRDQAIISSYYGDIYIEGTGVGTGINNRGVYVNDGAQILSVGTGDNAANISITGTGGNGTEDNFGIYFDEGIIETEEGAVTLNGTGGNGSGNSNYGVFLTGDSMITSAGLSEETRGITITGTGGNGDESNHGVYIISDSRIEAGLASINIMGTGGDGTGRRNYGVYLNGGAQVVSSGRFIDGDLGDVTITGTGGNGTSENYGTYITGSGTEIFTRGANVNITGTGASTVSSSNRGVLITTGAVIDVRDTGDISITGTAGDGGTNTGYGVQIGNNGAGVSSAGGNVAISGTGGDGSGNDNHGIYLYNNAVISTVDDGNITLTARANELSTDFDTDNTTHDIGDGALSGNITVNMDTESMGSSIEFSTDGEVFIRPRTNTTTIGLGNTASGDIAFTDDELSTYFNNVNKVTFGSETGTGLVELNDADINFEIDVVGGNIDVNSGGFVTDQVLTLRANSNINITGDIETNDTFSALASGNLTVAGTMGSPILIDTSGNDAVFSSNGNLTINEYVSVDALNGLRIYGSTPANTVVEGTANATPMEALLPVLRGAYNEADTGFGLYYRSSAIPETVITPQAKVIKVIEEPLVEPIDEKEEIIVESAIEEKENDRLKSRSCLASFMGVGCIIEQIKYGDIAVDMIDQINKFSKN